MMYGLVGVEVVGIALVVAVIVIARRNDEAIALTFWC